MRGSAMHLHAGASLNVNSKLWSRRNDLVRAIRFSQYMRRSCGTWLCLLFNGTKRRLRYAEYITTRNPNHVGAWRLMTVSMGLLGRIDEAREALARTLALQPDLSSAHVTNDTVYENPSDRTNLFWDFRRRG